MSRDLDHRDFRVRRVGTLYGIIAAHPVTGQRVTAYVGKTFQDPWTDRIEQHVWGGGLHRQAAKPWADIVPGWRPDGTAAEIVAAGGAFVLWQRRVSPFGLWWREIVAIWSRRPYFNVQYASCTFRQIVRLVASEWWAAVRRPVRTAAAVATLLAVGVLSVPGMPGAAVETQMWDHRAAVLGGVVVVGAVWRSVRRGGSGRRRRGRARRRARSRTYRSTTRGRTR